MAEKKSRKKSFMDSANEVIADAKTRVVSVSASVSDIVNSVGHYIYTKSLNENGQHSENDKKLIEQKNFLIKKKTTVIPTSSLTMPQPSGFKLNKNQQSRFRK